MSGQTMVASDIDGTLHISRHLQDLPEHGDILTDQWATGRTVTGVRGWQAWQELSTRRSLIPVTGRSFERFFRMRWPGPRPRLAILAGGGVITTNGQPREDWTRHATVAAHADGWSPSRITQMLAQEMPDIPIRVPDGAIGLLCALSPTQHTSTASEVMRHVAAEHGWLVSVQGRKSFLQAPSTSKAAALAWLAERESLTIAAAAGDSALDVGMMHLAHVALAPAASEAYHHRGHVPMTSIHGTARGTVEEIAKCLLSEIIART